MKFTLFCIIYFVNELFPVIVWYLPVLPKQTKRTESDVCQNVLHFFKDKMGGQLG